MISKRNTSESGYTLQTLIIISIIVLAAVVSSVLLYSVLRTSTTGIAQGSETYDGRPGGPQNLRVSSTTPASGTGVDVNVVWDPPSYLGEFPPNSYTLVLRNNNDGNPVPIPPPPATQPTSCEIDPEDNLECTFQNVDTTEEYTLEFTTNLGSASGESLGGETYYKTLTSAELSPLPAPPLQVEVSNADSGEISVSWSAPTGTFIYRIQSEEIPVPGSSPPTTVTYRQCFRSTGGMVTRQIVNSEMLPISEDNPSSLVKGTSYSFEVAVSNDQPSPPSNFCQTDSNFGGATTFSAKRLDLPNAPVLPSPPVRDDTGSGLPSLKVTVGTTANPCPSDIKTTIYWERQDIQEDLGSYSIVGCGVAAAPDMPMPSDSPTTTACTSSCEIFVTEQFAIDGRYKVWAVFMNEAGTSLPTARYDWQPTTSTSGGGVATTGSSPRNVQIFPEFRAAEGIHAYVSWDPPNLTTDENSIGGYIIKEGVRMPGGVCPVTLDSSTDGFSQRIVSADKQASDFQVVPLANVQTYSTVCVEVSAYYTDLTITQTAQHSVTYSPDLPSVTDGAGELTVNLLNSPAVDEYVIQWAPYTLADRKCAYSPTSPDTVLDNPAKPVSFYTKTIEVGEATAEIPVLSHTIRAMTDRQYLIRITTTLTNGYSFTTERAECTNLKYSPSFNISDLTNTNQAAVNGYFRWESAPTLHASGDMPIQQGKLRVQFLRTRSDLTIYDATNHDTRYSDYYVSVSVTGPTGTTLPDPICVNPSRTPYGVPTTDYAASSGTPEHSTFTWEILGSTTPVGDYTATFAISRFSDCSDRATITSEASTATKPSPYPPAKTITLSIQPTPSP